MYEHTHTDMQEHPHINIPHRVRNLERTQPKTVIVGNSKRANLASAPPVQIGLCCPLRGGS